MSRAALARHEHRGVFLLYCKGNHRRYALAS